MNQEVLKSRKVSRLFLVEIVFSRRYAEILLQREWIGWVTVHQAMERYRVLYALIISVLQ